MCCKHLLFGNVGSYMTRHGAYRETKAVRGRGAVRNISKRYEDVPQSKIY